MPFKPNYRFDKAARTRSKEAKKIEKLECRAARSRRSFAPSDDRLSLRL